MRQSVSQSVSQSVGLTDSVARSLSLPACDAPACEIVAYVRVRQCIASTHPVAVGRRSYRSSTCVRPSIVLAPPAMVTRKMSEAEGNGGRWKEDGGRNHCGVASLASAATSAMCWSR